MKRRLEERWVEISPYLDQVLDLEGDAREQWLADLEVSSPQIAQRVRVWLRKLEIAEAEDFLGGSVPTPSVSLAGQQFGAYTLDVALGHGGMGSVWLAHRSDGRFEGQAAVKLLSPALVGHPSERRFAREGNVLARLQHPNISRLLDAGVVGGSQPYLVLEYVPGEPIDRYCERNALGFRQRITLFLDVLEAVAHAHSNLIVHRDIKPANILVTEEGVVKLLDFGVAALLSPSAEATHLTHHSVPGLTPGYAAPEQLRREPVTTATDVYALGLVLFLLLAGRHPFAGEEETARQLMQAMREGEAPRPSDLAVNVEHARLLRGDLDNVIRMALRLNPAERYATVPQFAQDLRRYLAHEPVSARAHSMRYVAMKFVRRHVVSVILTTAIVALLIAATAVTATQMLEARRQRDQARFEARRAEASNDFLELLMLTDADKNQPPPSFHDRMELAVEVLSKQYREDPSFAGRMFVQLATNYVQNLEMSRASELYEKAYEMGRRNHDVELMAYAQCNRAFAEADANVGGGLSARLEEAQQLLQELHDPDPVVKANCLMAEARRAQRRGQSELAESQLRSALRILKERGSSDRPIYNDVLSLLANLYLARNQPSEALRFVQLSGELHDRNGRGGTSTRLAVRNNAATDLSAMGEVSAAMAEHKIVYERAKELQRHGPIRLTFPVNYAKTLARMDRPQEALQILGDVREAARLSGNPYALAQTLSGIATSLTQLRRWDEANATLEEIGSIASAGLNDKNLRAMVEMLKAQLDFARGHLRAAHQHVSGSLAILGYGTSRNDRALPWALLIAAQIAVAERNAADAERFARDALAIYEPIARGPDTSADVGEALLRLAQARILSGARADTKAVLERAVRCLSNGLAPDHSLTVEARNLLATA